MSGASTSDWLVKRLFRRRELFSNSVREKTVALQLRHAEPQSRGTGKEKRGASLGSALDVTEKALRRYFDTCQRFSDDKPFIPHCSKSGDTATDKLKITLLSCRGSPTTVDEDDYRSQLQVFLPTRVAKRLDNNFCTILHPDSG